MDIYKIVVWIVTYYFSNISIRVMTLDLRPNIVSTKYLENKLIDFTKFYMCIHRQYVSWSCYLSFMAHWLQRNVLELYRGSYMSAHVLLN